MKSVSEVRRIGRAGDAALRSVDNNAKEYRAAPCYAEKSNKIVGVFIGSAPCRVRRMLRGRKNMLVSLLRA